jgi:hypothetical protein
MSLRGAAPSLILLRFAGEGGDDVSRTCDEASKPLPLPQSAIAGTGLEVSEPGHDGVGESDNLRNGGGSARGPCAPRARDEAAR